MISASDIHNGKILVIDECEAKFFLRDRVLRGADYRSVGSTTGPCVEPKLFAENANAT